MAAEVKTGTNQIRQMTAKPKNITDKANKTIKETAEVENRTDKIRQMTAMVEI